MGALRGENTELMLDRLGPGVELHVIDPVPDFDPAEHEERFGGRYFFYRDLSVNVLDRLPVMDVALIDGAAVNGSARLVGWVAQTARGLQSGYLYHYAFATIIGLSVLLAWLLWRS